MKTNDLSFNRRRFFIGLLGWGIGAAGGYFGMTRNSFAMGSKSYPQGMRKILGDVRVNGNPAQIGTLVNPGDLVTTGSDSMAIFVYGTDVYMIRDHTRLDLADESSQDAKEKLINVLKILNGKMMVVFRRGRKRVITSTAVAGVRGTGFYVESDPVQTYICNCYGTMEIASAAYPDIKEKVRTFHHEKPRYVKAAGSPEQILARAPVINHTDEELILLESMVGRRPPFVTHRTGGDGGNGGGY